VWASYHVHETGGKSQIGSAGAWIFELVSMEETSLEGRLQRKGAASEVREKARGPVKLSARRNMQEARERSSFFQVKAARLAEERGSTRHGGDLAKGFLPSVATSLTR